MLKVNPSKKSVLELPAIDLCSYSLVSIHDINKV